MADDKLSQDNRDRSKVAGDEDYEAKYLAEKTGSTTVQARGLIRQYGNDRAKLDEKAKALKRNQ